MGGFTTAIRPTFSVRIQPHRKIAQTRLPRTAAEAYVMRFNRMNREEGAWAEMLLEDDRVSWPSDDPVAVRSP